MQASQAAVQLARVIDLDLTELADWRPATQYPERGHLQVNAARFTPR